MPKIATGNEVNRLSAIVRIHYSIGAILDLTEIGRILVRELTDMLDCNTCAIMLIDDLRISILAEKGFSKTFANMAISKDIPAIKQVLDTKQSIFPMMFLMSRPLIVCLMDAL